MNDDETKGYILVKSLSSREEKRNLYSKYKYDKEHNRDTDRFKKIDRWLYYKPPSIEISKQKIKLEELYFQVMEYFYSEREMAYHFAELIDEKGYIIYQYFREFKFSLIDRNEKLIEAFTKYLNERGNYGQM